MVCPRRSQRSWKSSSAVPGTAARTHLHEIAALLHSKGYGHRWITQHIAGLVSRVVTLGWNLAHRTTGRNPIRGQGCGTGDAPFVEDVRVEHVVDVESRRRAAHTRRMPRIPSAVGCLPPKAPRHPAPPLAEPSGQVRTSQRREVGGRRLADRQTATPPETEVRTRPRGLHLLQMQVTRGREGVRCFHRGGAMGTVFQPSPTGGLT